MMNIFSRTDDEIGVTIISVSGDVDIAAIPSLRSAVDRSILDGASAVVLDLGDVESIDSMGFAVMSTFGALCKSANASYAVSASNPDVRNFLSREGLSRQSLSEHEGATPHTYTSLDAALASLRAEVT